MSTAIDLKLLIELISLYDRYGSEAFARLADKLAEGTIVDDLEAALRGLPREIDKQAKSRIKTSPQSRPSPHEEMARLRDDFATSDVAFASFVDQCVTGAILKSKASVISLVDQVGLNLDVKRESRISLLLKVLRRLSKMPLAQRSELMHLHLKGHSDDLSGWVHIIVKE